MIEVYEVNKKSSNIDFDATDLHVSGRTVLEVSEMTKGNYDEHKNSKHKSTNWTKAIKRVLVCFAASVMGVVASLGMIYAMINW